MCWLKCSNDTSRWCPFSLGLAIGLLKGLWLLGLAWVAWLSGYGMDKIEMIQKYYQSYEPTFMGGLLGGLYGLICGFIIGFFIAWFYNICISYCCKKKSKGKSK